MKAPVRILSDLHLGHRGSLIESAEQLAPLLDGVGTVVCNGDVWEELAPGFRERGAVLLDDWRRLLDGRGVEFVGLPGNHDPGLGERGFLDLAGGAVLVQHGDAIFAENAPWHRLVPKRRRRIAEAFRGAGAEAEHLEGRLKLAGDIARMLVSERIRGNRSLPARCWDAVMPPGRALRMLLAWANFPQQAARFAERFRPQARVFVCGHFHLAGVWHRRGRLVVNTGSFMPPGPAWFVDFDGEWMAVGRIVRDGALFRPGERVGLWRVGVD